MAKAPEKDAKKDAKKDKAPAEDMIEKPREPMFSKLGMMVFIGSNVIVAVIITGIAMFASGGGEAAPTPDDQNQNTRFNANQKWLPMENVTAAIMSPGGKNPVVRFSVAISFAGEPVEQDAKMTTWGAEGRQFILRRIASQVMSRYDTMAVKEQSFRDTYAKALVAEINANIDEKVTQANLYDFRPPE